MSRPEFLKYLAENSREFSFRETTRDGEPGVAVANNLYRTSTFFADAAIGAGELSSLLAATHRGKKIEHITRVTGYFSKVKSWNTGKVSELADRMRTPL